MSFETPHKFELTIDWMPTSRSFTKHVIQVHISEKSKGTTVDPKPGDDIIYGTIAMALEPGKRL